jgi:transposase
VRRPGRKLGEDVTETLECEPRRWKVVEHVREKVSCRCCEAISQPPAPSHPIARGRAGPNLLALVLAAKYGQHLPLTRQSAIYAREGVELEVSTLADWVGSSTASLMPLVLEVRAHVFAAERLHGDDTTVPVLAKEQTKIGRVWGYVRDDRPFGGPDPPAVAIFYSPDRGGEHPERHLASFAGILQADAYAGLNRLYTPEREPGPILEAACWAHARRKLFELAAISEAPIAAEAVRRIDGLFAIEREINGKPAEERLSVRKERARPLVIELEAWLRVQHARVSRKSEVGKAIAYALNHWAALSRFLDDGRICLSNNAAERALRGIAVGRRNWTFAGSDRGGERAAADLHPDRDGQAQRRRPAGLARRRARPAARSSRQADRRPLPWNWRSRRSRSERPLDVACPHWTELHAQTGPISGLHLRVHARARPASRRGRPAAALRRQPAFRPPDGAHPRTSGADPTAARGRPLHRGARCSRAAPGLTLTLSEAAESLVSRYSSWDASPNSPEPALREGLPA